MDWGEVSKINSNWYVSLDNLIESKVNEVLNQITVNRSPIKSIQRGYKAYSSDKTRDMNNISITINEINPDKCIVILQPTDISIGVSSTSSSRTAYVYAPALYSLSETQLVVTFSGTHSGVGDYYYYSDFSWQIIEFY